MAVTVQPGTVSVSAASIEATMTPITSVYQYVGGGVDNSSLNGVAAENSAVYTANGKTYTAFRIPGRYVTDSADFSTIVLDGVSYPIVERGLILGTAGQELTVDSPAKVVTTGDFKSKYWAYDETTGTVTYTALVKNVVRANKDVEYIARSYVKIAVGGSQQIVYSDTCTAFTPQQIYDAAVEVLAAQGKAAPTWFKPDNTDDGVVDLG